MTQTYTCTLANTDGRVMATIVCEGGAPRYVHVALMEIDGKPDMRPACPSDSPEPPALGDEYVAWDTFARVANAVWVRESDDAPVAERSALFVRMA
jgi:hypothetical protein